MGNGTAIYARQSFDRYGDELAVARQLKECRRFADERGWTVTAEYVDNDRSATTGTARPEFEGMLAARPQRIVVWHTDRLVRLTKELERVIGLGVNVHAVKAGDLDLSHPAGRATAKTVTAWAEYEGEQRVLRQKAANDQRAEAGLPYTRQRAFGYEFGGMTIKEDEAAEIRAAADALVRGRSLASICRDMNARGVTTVTGRPWRPTPLKVLLLSPRPAGLRRHRRKVIGKAAWPAILDEGTAASVRNILTDPKRQQRGPTRRYLLSGVLTCGRCGGRMTGKWVNEGDGRAVYNCGGHVTRKITDVDDFIVRLTLARLTQPDARDLFARPGADPKHRTALEDQRASLLERKALLAEDFALGGIDRESYQRAIRRADERVEQLEAELAALVTDPTLAEIVTAVDVQAAWEALPLETQRRVIATLMHITLVSRGPGNHAWDPQKALRITWA